LLIELMAVRPHRRAVSFDPKFAANLPRVMANFRIGTPSRLDFDGSDCCECALALRNKRFAVQGLLLKLATENPSAGLAATVNKTLSSR
jgi:hypothetical protein